MRTHDTFRRAYLTTDSAKPGMQVWLDGGFTCCRPGCRTLHDEGSGLFFECADGEHFIDGQDDGNGILVGIYPTDPGPMEWEQRDFGGAKPNHNL